MAATDTPSRLDNDLERLRARGAGEGLIGIENLIEPEAMRYQLLRIDLSCLDGPEQHRCRDRIDEAGRHRDVMRPQTLQMEVNLLAMHADIGDGSARRDNVLTKTECRGNAHRLDGGIDAAPTRHLHHRFGGLAVLAVDRRRRAEPLRDGEAIVVEV